MTTDLVTVPASPPELPAVAADLRLEQSPQAVLNAARDAARALTDVINKKKNPVRFKGEVYLEFEDWQTLGRFYSVTAKVASVEPIELGKARGFHAVAVALHHGHELSRAEAWCFDDEPNWKGKLLNQIASMAQTRACCKALRNVLSWVVVLAGYAPTPAEEMTDDVVERTQSKPVAKTIPPERRTDDDDRVGSQLISSAQAKRLFAVATEHKWTRDQIQALLGRCGYSRSAEITRSDYDQIILTLEAGPAVPPADDLQF